MAADPRSRPTCVRLLVLALSCGLSFLLYLHRYTWGFVKKEVQSEFGWDTVTLGTLDGLFTFSYALGQVPAGMMCDWFGAHFLLGGSVILWSMALAGTVAATGIVSMATARLAFGVSQSACYPVLGKVSKNWFPLAMRPMAQGMIATLFGRGGGAAAFLIFGGFMLGHLEMPWRDAVLVLSVIGIAVGVLFLLLFRNTPREHPWANQAEADLVVADDPAAAHASRSRLNWAAALRSRNVLLLFARGIASNMADALYIYWLPFYLLGYKKLDVADAAWMSALPLLGGAVGGIVSGTMQTVLIRRNRRWARSGIGLTGKLVAAGLMLIVLGLERPEVIACVFLAVKFFSDWEQPAEWGAITDVAGRSAATLFASVNMVGAFGGALAGPLIGMVLHSYSSDGVPTAEGWNAVFIIIAVEYTVASMCWLGIDCRKTIGERS